MFEERKKFIKRYYFLDTNVIKIKELMNHEEEVISKQLSVFIKTLLQTV